MPEEVGEHVDDGMICQINLSLRLLKAVIGDTSCCWS